MKLTKIGIVAALAIMLAAFLWAFDGVVLTPWVTKLGMTDVPTFVFMLHVTASVFLSYFFFKRWGELKNLGKQDWLAFILVGLFGGALGTMAIIAAIIKVYSEGLNISVVLLLQKLQPVFAILLALLWLKERPKKVFYLWAILALIGSYFLTFGFDRPNFSAGGMLIPALLSLLAAFSFGSSTAFSKKAVTRVSHGMGTALRFTVTTAIMALLIIVISLLNRWGVNTSYAGLAGFRVMTWSLLGAFVIIALTTGGTAIFIYYYGLKRVTASQSTMYELIFPVSAIVLEFIIHHKTLSSGQWLGAIIVITAIAMIVKITSNRGQTGKQPAAPPNQIQP